MSSVAFRITLAFKRASDNGSVYFKPDGERFDKTSTMKLNIDTEYCITVSIRPPREIRALVIHGDRRDPTLCKSDDVCSIYKCDWSTHGLTVSKKKARSQINFSVEFPHSTLQTSLQCKLYNPTDTNHNSWGQCLHGIEMECKQPKGATYVDITREKYL